MRVQLAEGARAAVRLLNHPPVKEGVKHVLHSVTFAFGLIEAYDLYQIARGREVSTEQDAHAPKWMQVANKIILLAAKISLVLSAATSRPGVFLISHLVGSFVSSAQLTRVFGPNTVFAQNPWHPRHVTSIAAVVLALPAVLQSVYRGIRWTTKTQPWLTDAKVRLMALFNTATSRPTLHLGNSFCRWAFF